MGLFGKKPLVRVAGAEILIDADQIKKLRPSERATRELCDERPVLRLGARAPQLVVKLGAETAVRYRIDPTEADPDLEGRFLHASIRILDNLMLMMDGLISRDEHDQDAGAARGADGQSFTEAIRFQPRFIGPASERMALFAGKGLFERGLHYPGQVTPGNVRACAVCDRCGDSFGLEHFHTGFGAGFGSGQYFYCGKGIHTAIVDPERFPGCPGALEEPDAETLAQAEARLPPCGACRTAFRYLNPLRCPHCSAAYIDFEAHPAMRPNEYYGCVIVGEKAQRPDPTS